MSDWTWEYVPDAANVVGGLTEAQIGQVEKLVSRIADAVAVRRIGTSFDVSETVSNVKSYGQGPLPPTWNSGIGARWVSTAPFGRTVVPEVQMTCAALDPSTRFTGGGATPAAARPAGSDARAVRPDLACWPE